MRFARNLLVARALGYQTIFTVHNVAPTYTLRPAWVDFLGHWCAVNLTNRVIVHSQAARQAVTRRYGRRHGIDVVEHAAFVGVYPQDIDKATARAELGLDPNQTVFAFVGGIRPNKGVHRVIDAFRALPGQNVRLVIAGEAWRPQEYIDRLCSESALDPRIDLRLGRIPDAQLQVYYKAADAIVLPFEAITTSGSAILAMSMGRPVIAPARGCLPELINPENGILYAPDAHDGLGHALRLALRSDLASMGEAAFERVRDSTWERMARHTQIAYQSRTRKKIQAQPVRGLA
jgi:glycosyltransferase involved in cell wall biosynthesis